MRLWVSAWSESGRPKAAAREGYVMSSWLLSLVFCGKGGGRKGGVRWPDAAGCDDKVVGGAHAAGCFDDLGFVIGDNLDALQLDSEVKAVACEER